ncbi:hypothetical protein CMV_021708 [Castanea mollissima]|uniref:Uncharacterized protein n=1 Tax=Castanea mollissima TaxID=60419 RepID=A0A8J4QNJ1_9ROSI|nr:hypothetical protein CMV_021708 [Castanea mollissima]
MMKLPWMAAVYWCNECTIATWSMEEIFFFLFFYLPIKVFNRQAKDLESRNHRDTNKMLNEKKQPMIIGCSL